MLEEVMRVPAQVVRDFSGLAIDIGGSAGKLLYRTRDDYEQAQMLINQANAHGNLHVLTCSISELDVAIGKIKQDVYLTRQPGEATRVKSGGLGVYQQKAKLQEAFDVEIDNLVEGDCLLAGLKYYITVLPEQDVLHGQLVHVINETINAANARNQITANMNKDSNNKFFTTNTQLVPVKERTLSNSASLEDALGDALYPCIIAHLGSNHGYMLYHKDGSAKFCETSRRGGKCFMGIGSLLTGAKTYDELLDLAEKGDHMVVDSSISDLVEKGDREDDPDDPYSKLGTESNDRRVAFMFGNAVFKDRDAFQPADLALAWLKAHMSDVVATLHHHVASNNIKHVLVTGSLVNRELARACILEQFIQLDNLMMSAYGKVFQPEISFLRHGGMLQACGAMLSEIEP